MTVGERVLEAMKARGLGFNELDRALGKSQGYTSRLTRSDRNPRSDTVQALAEALGVAYVWLLEGRGDMVLGEPEGAADEAERYPNRNVAARLARTMGVAERAIESVMRDRLDFPGDPEVKWWVTTMQHREALVQPSQADVDEQARRDRALRDELLSRDGPAERLARERAKKRRKR